MRRTFEAGLIQKWQSELKINYKSTDTELGSTVLTLKNMAGGIFILIFSTTLSSIVFFCERWAHRTVVILKKKSKTALFYHKLFGTADREFFLKQN